VKHGDPTDVVIPAGQVSSAMSDLCGHIRAIHAASTYLYCEGSHAAASYFAILCLEEISKQHKLDLRRRCGKGVTLGDMQGWYSHRKKIHAFLRNMHDASGARDAGTCEGGERSTNYSPVAAKLNFMKQLAVYHEYLGGTPATLEGMLGRDAMIRASMHLQRVTCQGIAAMGAMRRGGQGLRKGRDAGQPNPGIDASLAAIMELAQGVPITNPPKDGVVLAHKSLGSTLGSLWQHIGDLDILAVKLHNSNHHAASIFMSIISFEEANKYYAIARCRRSGNDVCKADMAPLLDHKAKLTVFLNDVMRYQERQNAGRGATATGKYHVVNAEGLLRLNGLKHISMYFTHVCGRTVTLERLIDLGSGGVSTYLRKLLMGMVSWAIMCDGDSDDPYKMHAVTRTHAQRLKALVDFKEEERCRGAEEYTYYLIGLLDCLNSAICRHDARRCGETLALIEGLA